MSETSGIEPPLLVTQAFLPAEERAALLRWTLDNRDRFRPARTAQGVEPAGRDALTLRDLGPWADRLRDRALASVADWTGQLRVTPFEASQVELELAAHNDGSHFALHSDTYLSSQPASGDRMLSAVYYFHEAPLRFEGGALRLHRVGAPAGSAAIDVSPDCDRLVVFPSWWPHEVLRVSCPSRVFEDSRFSLNCWLHRARSA